MVSSLLLLAAPAEASCGLDQCPVDAAPRGERFVLRTVTRHTAAPDGAARYLQQYLGGYVQLGPARLGASMPLVIVQDAYGPWIGPGNGLLFGEASTPDGRFGGGVQLEIPTTTRADDSGHVVVLPYLHSQLAAGPADLRLRLGWLTTVGGSAHFHPAGPRVQVDPHTDSELIGRVSPGVTVDLGESQLRPALTTTCVLPLVEPGAVVQAGGALSLSRSRLVLRLDAEAPFTQARRFDARVGLSLSYLHPETS